MGATTPNSRWYSDASAVPVRYQPKAILNGGRALLVEWVLIRSVWNLMFRFQGPACSPLEALILTEARAVVPFRNGRGVITTVRDITRERRMEQEVRAHAARLAAINEIANAVNQSLTIEDIFDVAAAEARRIVTLDRLTIARVERPCVEARGDARAFPLPDGTRVRIRSEPRRIDGLDHLLHLSRLRRPDEVAVSDEVLCARREELLLLVEHDERRVTLGDRLEVRRTRAAHVVCWFDVAVVGSVFPDAWPRDVSVSCAQRSLKPARKPTAA